MARPALAVADIFRNHGPAWRYANRGHVSVPQLKAMSAIEDCRMAVLGGHVTRCENAICGHDRRQTLLSADNRATLIGSRRQTTIARARPQPRSCSTAIPSVTSKSGSQQLPTCIEVPFGLDQIHDTSQRQVEIISSRDTPISGHHRREALGPADGASWSLATRWLETGHRPVDATGRKRSKTGEMLATSAFSSSRHVRSCRCTSSCSQ
jgi:hypothetical protein